MQWHKIFERRLSSVKFLFDPDFFDAIYCIVD